MKRCSFWYEKYAELDDEHKMIIKPSVRCGCKKYLQEIFCRKHYVETKSYLPSRVWEMAAKTMKQELDKKRGKK